MIDVVQRALAHWAMSGAQYELVSARENLVYRVSHGGRDFALRLHRAGYHSNEELRSELQWMAELQRAGMAIPAPLPDKTGEFLQTMDGVQVDILTWLPGIEFAVSVEGMGTPAREGLFFACGRQTARLHRISDAWQPPPEFTRRAWDRPGLVGEAPVWGRFWDSAALNGAEQAVLSEFRDAANRDLSGLEASLDYGLIHADLLGHNMLVDGGAVKFIDFDDGGFGFRLFELATTLFWYQDDKDFARLKSRLIDGYRSLRPMDTGALDLFLALRGATYVGWIADRGDVEDAAGKSRLFIDGATALARQYLDNRNT
jgi:Ser/Thr protein kinase RdoA (MazF antagonist)